jgi:hypothetical protein
MGEWWNGRHIRLKTVWPQGRESSSLSSPTICLGNGDWRSGSALALGARGPRFESAIPDHAGLVERFNVSFPS